MGRFTNLIQLVFIFINMIYMCLADSAEIISPKPGQHVTQDMTITVNTMRWGMSSFVGGNYTVQTMNGTLIYGPVVISDFGHSHQNLTVIGIGSYNIVLNQGQSYMNQSTKMREYTYSTTVVPFTVVADEVVSLPIVSSVTETSTSKPTDPSNSETPIPSQTNASPPTTSVPTTDDTSVPTTDDTSVPTTNDTSVPITDDMSSSASHISFASQTLVILSLAVMSIMILL